MKIIFKKAWLTLSIVTVGFIPSIAISCNLNNVKNPNNLEEEIMEKIGLIIADDNEIQQVEEFVLQDKLNHDGFEVSLYKYKNKMIYVIHSRIGLVNATIATQYLINKYNVNSIWNYGAVGAIEGNIYDVVIPNKFYYFDVTTPWYKRGQTPGEDEFYLNSLQDEKNINIGSGNSFVTDSKYLEEIRKEIDIHLIDMESTAIAQTCSRNKIDFYCIKGISDIIGKNLIDKDQINNSIKKASKLAFNKMIEYWD